MKVRVCYHGALRARLGLDWQWLDLPPLSSVHDVAEAACGHLGPEWPQALRFAVNDEMASAHTLLTQGDSVDLLPPVSGGSGGEGSLGPLDCCFLTGERLDTEALLERLDDPASGALAVFVGRVRREQDGRPVLRLEYEAHEGLALKELQCVAQDARARWTLGPILMAHRVGRLDIGDTAVIVAVASGHRAAAFEACRFLIDAIKARVPVWKHEFYADAGEAWLGAPGAAPTPFPLGSEAASLPGIGAASPRFD